MALRFAACRDEHGALWSTEVTIAATADALSCGGCWFGNAFGALYSISAAVWWKPATDPDDWSAAAVATGLSGQVWGLALNEAGAMCALIGDTPYLSRDRGATWEAGGAIGGLSARPRTLTSLRHWFVVIQPDADGLRHWVSEDAGASWK